MATQAQMELQASVRMTALENIDMQRDLLNWENQMKSEEKRTKIPRENVKNHHFYYYIIQ